MYGSDDYPFATVSWFVYAGISCFLVIFAGIMSGLTLGLMSLSIVDLEILQSCGSSSEKKQAGKVLFCPFVVLIKLLFFIQLFNIRFAFFSCYFPATSKTTPAACNFASL